MKAEPDLGWGNLEFFYQETNLIKDVLPFSSLKIR